MHLLHALLQLVFSGSRDRIDIFIPPVVIVHRERREYLNWRGAELDLESFLHRNVGVLVVVAIILQQTRHLHPEVSILEEVNAVLVDENFLAGLRWIFHLQRLVVTFGEGSCRADDGTVAIRLQLAEIEALGWRRVEGDDAFVGTLIRVHRHEGIAVCCRRFDCLVEQIGFVGKFGFVVAAENVAQPIWLIIGAFATRRFFGKGRKLLVVRQDRFNFASLLVG